MPEGAKLLMLGSFPPPKNRWCMDFYYPNFNNDMWRILGKVFYGERDYFVCKQEKRFDKEKIVAFLSRTGIGIYDAAESVNRLKGNASDAFLEVVSPADLKKLLAEIPECRAIVTTGTLATKTVAETFRVEAPSVGGKVPFCLEARKITLYRTPSSSRAYPLAFEKKVEAYRKVFSDVKILR